MTVTNWTAASGTWTTQANWSAGVPGTTDIAAFNEFLGAATAAPSVTVVTPGSGETVSGTGQTGTLVVSDPVTFVGTVADAVGIIQATATAYDGGAKLDLNPSVVLGGQSAAWSSSTGLILGTGTSLLVENGATLSVGAAALTVEAGAAVSLSDATLSGPVILAGGILAGSGNETLSGGVQVSGTGTILANGSTAFNNPESLFVSGPVSGGALSVGGSTPVPPGSPGAGFSALASAVGTLVLAGADTLPAGIGVFEGETLELASADAAGGGPISVQAGAALVVDAGARVAQPITIVSLPLTSNSYLLPTPTAWTPS